MQLHRRRILQPDQQPDQQPDPPARRVPRRCGVGQARKRACSYTAGQRNG